MVLMILMLFSIFYCTAGNRNDVEIFGGPFTLCLDCDGSEVVDCNSVVVDRYIVSFDMTDRCCVWKMVLCWFGLWMLCRVDPRGLVRLSGLGSL